MNKQILNQFLRLDHKYDQAIRNGNGRRRCIYDKWRQVRLKLLDRIFKLCRTYNISYMEHHEAIETAKHEHNTK